MISDSWPRIGGFHMEPDGTVGAAWLAVNPVSSTVYCYDCALFTREVEAVIVASFTARGRGFPMAWRKQDAALAATLEDAGINVLPDPTPDDQAMAEIISRGIWQKMRASTFRVDETAAEWLQEYKMFYMDENTIPEKGFPIMAATRHAIKELTWASPLRAPESQRQRQPEVMIY